MIAIVILGLGLILVGTMFPVAWDRARTLTEATTQQTITKNAHAIIQNITRVSGQPSGNVFTHATSFEGDLQLDLNGFPVRACVFGGALQDMVTDTRVHALNLENVLVAPGTKNFLVNEKPWALADPERLLDQLNQEIEDATLGTREKQFFDATFFTPRVNVGERVFPSVGPPPVGVDGGAPTPEALARRTDRLASSRFVWAVLHRLESLACVGASGPDFSATRSLEMFYVTLRRPQPTLRYARQDPRSTPDPCDLTAGVAKPKPLGPELDVLFPVAWRVQVQFPSVEARRFLSNPPKPGEEPTGIPTEIEVPPSELSSDEKTGMMLVQMFQPGTRFIDEITGQIFRVAKRRITGDVGEQATLTLDREVVFEDLNLAPMELCGGTFIDPRCDCKPDRLVPEELVRTVWVFPPPVERFSGTVAFVGKSPVVDISVRTLTIAPTQ